MYELRSGIFVSVFLRVPFIDLLLSFVKTKTCRSNVCVVSIRQRVGERTILNDHVKSVITDI